MTQVVNPMKSKMNIHKNYWIKVLKDPSDGRELKMQFAEDLGFDCCLDAARYLENVEQTIFVGSWFLTDEEIELEEEKHKRGLPSVYMCTDRDPEGIKMLKKSYTDINGAFHHLTNHLDEFMPENSDRIEATLEAIVQIAEWSSDFNEGIGTLTKRGRTSLGLIDLLEEHASSPDRLIIILEMVRLFVHSEISTDWAFGSGLSSKDNMDIM
jgi:hypothetical protein